MKRPALSFLAVAAITSTGHSADATALKAVRALDGYRCMALNLPDSKLMNPSTHVAILSNPRAGSQPMGYASSTVIAADTPPVNGFRKVLRLDGKPGWMPASDLKPWVNPGNNGQGCVPSVMSNGRLGFGIK